MIFKEFKITILLNIVKVSPCFRSTVITRALLGKTINLYSSDVGGRSLGCLLVAILISDGMTKFMV